MTAKPYDEARSATDSGWLGWSAVSGRERSLALAEKMAPQVGEGQHQQQGG